ncbi:DUF3817 domain-containing protein [Leucobacter sp. W1153]|uniref:DUF3817 domain-containing protein n=1 Tax=unclassified Leucobacter TaxID=2621730 RepID=UPI003F33B44A
MFQSPRALFRTFAFAEVVSWTLLIAGLITRALTDWAPAVAIGGGIHGFIFLCYGATAILVAKNQRWGVGVTLVALLSAIIPYATIPTEMWVNKSGRLVGAWRTVPTSDARDARWHDRAFRFLITHPILTGVAMLAAVVLLYVVLLILGPPVKR